MHVAPARWAACLAAGMLLTVLPLVGCRPTRRPSTAPAYLLGVVFENGAGEVFDDSFPHLRRRAADVNLVFPFWYSLDTDGSLVRERRRDEVIGFARERRMQLVPLINNLKRPGEQAGKILRDASSRSLAVRELLALVGRHPYDGVLLDFEGLEETDREPLSRFVAQLGPALRARGKKLAVAVYPDPATYDYRELGRTADYLLVMALDLHGPSTLPGPVAPLGWTRSLIEELLREGLPRDRLLLVVGAYGYDWPRPEAAGKVEFLPARELTRVAGAHAAPIGWDEASQQPFFRYRVAELGIEREVWFQNAHSIRQRAALVRELRLAGVVLWRLGFEEPETWPFLRRALGRE